MEKVFRITGVLVFLIVLGMTAYYTMYSILLIRWSIAKTKTAKDMDIIK